MVGTRIALPKPPSLSPFPTPARVRPCPKRRGRETSLPSHCGVSSTNDGSGGVFRSIGERRQQCLPSR
ncbi:hypothetical protein OPV22_017387 [Ensete ventricosum]|uniref:Uncharacterized protein n=1 Tax=Ensete ventricosum TaxID=4639 RepID=A0AAV8R0U3_ENSVE|nr:hypothetical protein OPV22_017387 [Ensete ventricosum]